MPKTWEAKDMPRHNMKYIWNVMKILSFFCETVPAVIQCLHRIARPSGMSFRKKFSDREFFSRPHQGEVAGKVPANAADKTGKGAVT